MQAATGSVFHGIPIANSGEMSRLAYRAMAGGARSAIRPNVLEASRMLSGRLDRSLHHSGWSNFVNGRPAALLSASIKGVEFPISNIRYISDCFGRTGAIFSSGGRHASRRPQTENS
jgi:hypothetical protein